MKSSRYIKRFGVVMAVALVAIGALAAAALADTPVTSESTATATIGGSAFLISTPLVAGAFGTTLNGVAQTLDGTGTFAASGSTFTIVDPRGTGVGWSVNLKATAFGGTVGDAVGKTMAVDTLTAPAFTVAQNNTDEAYGDSAVPGTLHAAAKIDVNGAGVNMVECNAFGQGMGTYNFTSAAAPWTLAIAAHDYKGTYESKVTTTLATLALH